MLDVFTGHVLSLCPMWTNEPVFGSFGTYLSDTANNFEKKRKNEKNDTSKSRDQIDSLKSQSSRHGCDFKALLIIVYMSVMSCNNI